MVECRAERREGVGGRTRDGGRILRRKMGRLSRLREGTLSRGNTKGKN